MNHSRFERAYDRVVGEYRHVMQPPIAGGRPIALHREFHKEPLERWYHPADHPAFAGHVALGRLQDGRWYLDSTVSDANGQWVFPDEAAARGGLAWIRALRPDDRWEQVPARAYDPRTDYR